MERKGVFFPVLAALALSLYAVSAYNYVLFHSLAEIFSIIIAVSLFLIAFNTKELSQKNSYLLFIGTAYLFVGFLDLVHTLSYKGMGVLAGRDDGGLAIQLWLSARWLQAAALAISPIFFKRDFSLRWGLPAFALITASSLMSIFYFKVFPVAFVEGSGLTPFKVVSEYAIIAAFAAAFVLYMKKFTGNGRIKNSMLASIGFAAMAELSFTLYTDVYGFFNFSGHVLKIVSFAFLCQALIIENLRHPLASLFAGLQREKEKLSRAANELETLNLGLMSANAELAQSREELGRANIKLAEASRAKSDFLANMSHELRTPLNSVIGFSEVLEDELYGRLNPKQKEYVGDVIESGRHLLDLINDILDLSKVEAGRMELDVSRFPLRDALGPSVSLLKEKAFKQGVGLGMEIGPVADTEVEADLRKVKQIMFNLLSNAIKFTDEGGTVSLRARPIGAEGVEMVEVTVEDTGIGISREDMPKLFKEFTQLEPPYTKKYEGTGLGLSLTKKLVELHGGAIRAESEPGRGSKFSFTIPLRAKDVSSESKRAGGAYAQSSNAKGDIAKEKNLDSRRQPEEQGADKGHSELQRI